MIAAMAASAGQNQLVAAFSSGGASSGAQGEGGLSSLGGMLGGVLGATAGPVGSMVGSALGSALGGALDGLLKDSVAGGVKDACKDLHREHGMPKGDLNKLMKLIEDYMSKMETKPCGPEARQEAQDKYGDKAKELRSDVCNDLVKNTLENKKCAQADGEDSSGSWLVALAKAMGQTLGKKVGNMVALSDKANAASDKAIGASGEEKQAAAGAQAAATTELQGASQDVKMFQESVSTVLKGIGEALAGMARK